MPVELETKLTRPLGVMAVLTSMSLTLAVQLVLVLLVTGLGKQLTVVEVARLLTVTVAPPLLTVWDESPP